MRPGDVCDPLGFDPLLNAPRHLFGTRVKRPRAMGDLVLDHYVQATAWEQGAFDVAAIDREIARAFQ